MNLNRQLSDIKNSILYIGYKKLNSKLASFLSNQPDNDMFLIGVTGSSGKTTTVEIIQKILNNNIGKVLSVSSKGVKIGNNEVDFDTGKELSTYDIHSILNMGKNDGCKIAIIEINSDNIKDYTYYNLSFDMGVLTNIHKDYFDKEINFLEYEQNKKKFFRDILRNHKKNKFGVFPFDDKIGRKWYYDIPFDNKYSYSITSSSTLQAESVDYGLDGTSININYLGKSKTINTKLLGIGNVYNILSACCVGLSLGLQIENIVKSINQIENIKKRFEIIKNNNVNYVLDESHTIESLELALKLLISKKQNRLIIVYSTDGIKNSEYRANISKLIEKYGDILIASDNTFEKKLKNRLTIIKDITKEIKKKEGESFFVIPNRKLGILFAKKISQAGDIVFICSRNNKSNLFVEKNNQEEKNIILKK